MKTLVICLESQKEIQGSHTYWKIWKIEEYFPVREYKKILEKSWNFRQFLLVFFCDLNCKQFQFFVILTLKEYCEEHLSVNVGTLICMYSKSKIRSAVWNEENECERHCSTYLALWHLK